MSAFKDAVVSLVYDAAVAAGAAVERADLAAAVSTPPKPELGDLALGCFPLAKALRKAPPAVAAELAEHVRAQLELVPVVDEVIATGPYLNFRANVGGFARQVLPAAVEGTYVGAEVGAGKRVVIDFSSPNVAKPFGIGHLRSTAIGAAIGRLFKARGYEVVGVNHIGDWGTQFGKLISAFLRWGDEAALDANPIQHLYELYVRFHEAEKKDEALAQEARDWFKRLEDGDEQARALWERFRSESLREFERIYGRMGVSFDHVWGEAFYEDKLGDAVTRLRESGILEESEGAWVVPVEAYYPGTSPCLILRSDGATLYTTRDVAAALYRMERFEPERLLYVVGADQADHFRKVFGTLKRLGMPWADRLEHVPFGRIQGISTRRGTLIFLEEVFDRAKELALEMMREREITEGMSEEEQLAEAEKIGLGAVIFFDLSKERIKDSVFSWDAILQISGRTGVGLQYSHVRLKRLVERYEATHGPAPNPAEADLALLSEPALVALTHQLSDYGDVLARAAEAYEPAILARYLLDLADVFNAFYSSGEKIVSDDAALSGARVTLCRALLRVLSDGLAILGVPTPDRM
jgi:arginyl-tRNA synthetase